MDDKARQLKESDQSTEGTAARKHTLELCFILLLAFVVLGALLDALSYDLVSAMAPLCIIAPLLVLIGIQLVLTSKAGNISGVGKDLKSVLRGRNRAFNSVAGFTGSMLLFLALIFLLGHYLGMVVFMFLLIRVVSRERIGISVGLVMGVTIAIYALFEHGFHIELYRGVIFRLLSGYGA